MLKYLPQKLYKITSKINCINEIRLRVNSNPFIITNFDRFYVKEVNITFKDIENVVLTVCNRSIYSCDEQIKNGFLTTNNGERIGLCGEFVYQDGKLITIKNFSSLCIRIPNLITDVSLEFFNKIYQGGSVLIFSKTGVGKTTFLRDFAKLLSHNTLKNVVIVDERNEIIYKNQNYNFSLKNVDVLTYCTKNFAFNQAIRTLNPDVICTDELFGKNDILSVGRAILSGVDVICTTHADSFENLLKKEYLSQLIKSNYFNYFIQIENNNGIRCLNYYDSNFKKICLY